MAHETGHGENVSPALFSFLLSPNQRGTPVTPTDELSYDLMKTLECWAGRNAKRYSGEHVQAMVLKALAEAQAYFAQDRLSWLADAVEEHGEEG